MKRVGSLTILAACCSITLAAGATPPGTSPSGHRLQMVQSSSSAALPPRLARLLDTVNAHRRVRGLGDLTPHPALMEAARRHASDIAARRRLTHYGRDGSSPFDRIARAGYRDRHSGEVLSNRPTAAAVVEAWARSAVHAKIMLTPDDIHAGVAVVRGPQGGLWWVMLVAAPR